MNDQHLAPPRHYDVVARAIEFIGHHSDRQPELADVARAVSLSPMHLQRVFSEWAGISPKRFLQYLTKEHAKAALRASRDTLGSALSSGLSGGGRLHDLMINCEAMTPGEVGRMGAGVTVGHGFAATPFGTMLLAWTARGLCFAAFCDTDRAPALLALQTEWPAAALQEDGARAAEFAACIFGNTPLCAPLHLLLRGTNFQIKVWEALIRSQPGDLLSYGQLAERCGHPGAARAVGSAMAVNTLAYLIPCHRVIRENGDIGQYRWGALRKHAIQVWEAERGTRHDAAHQDLELSQD
jgi:AraC family transcriptional regulator, regulatory protein of adaptative response / methylated-DNA-[protein]-cysteine methyltransferase